MTATAPTLIDDSLLVFGQPSEARDGPKTINWRPLGECGEKVESLMARSPERRPGEGDVDDEQVPLVMGLGFLLKKTPTSRFSC